MIDLIVVQYPDVEVRALVRDEARGRKLEQRYRNVRAVLGALDDLDLIASESQGADIVISMSSNA